MTDIFIFQDGKIVGKTSRAFDVIEEKELMRAWTLTFTVDNHNPIRKYIKPNAMVEIDGQKFDVVSYQSNSGTQNITTVTAEHVSYRLNNYILPDGYAFVGTASQILQDILNVSGASAEFSVGTVADVGYKSFAIEEGQEVSVRSATLALQEIGVEVSYNNFKIDLPKRIGTDTDVVLEFGREVCEVITTWDKENGTTYDASVVSLWRVPNSNEGVTYTLGDDVQINDTILGEIINRRIVKYAKCHDDPAKDRITLGVFIRDSGTNAVAMTVALNEAKSKADNSVQVGTSYNNVDISHEYGFRSVSEDGTMRAFHNGTDGFVIQKYHLGKWVTIWQTKSEDGGKSIAYNLNHTQKVELGGTAGVKTYTSTDGVNWTETGGMGIDGLFSANKITKPGSTTYGIIGDFVDENDMHYWEGFKLVSSQGDFFRITSPYTGSFLIYNGRYPVLISYPDSGSVRLIRKKAIDVVKGDNSKTILQYQDEYNSSKNARVICDSDGIKFIKDTQEYGETQSFTVNTPTGTKTIHTQNGIITSMS